MIYSEVYFGMVKKNTESKDRKNKMMEERLLIRTPRIKNCVQKMIKEHRLNLVYY